MPGAPRTGHDEIRAGSEERRAAGQIGPGSNTRHVVSTVAVTVEGDRAVADSYWQLFVDTATAPRLQLMGTYHDELARTAAGWKLARRHISIG
jgi:3-phenylpropionate/cinnamic acid dioxygenase small subunit